MQNHCKYMCLLNFIKVIVLKASDLLLLIILNKIQTECLNVNSEIFVFLELLFRLFYYCHLNFSFYFLLLLILGMQCFFSEYLKIKKCVYNFLLFPLYI